MRAKLLLLAIIGTAASTPSDRSPVTATDSVVAAGTTLPPQVLAMLDRFPPPTTGAPSISTRFSHDTVSVGAPVELVTVLWIPKGLIDSLRRPPVVTSPSLSGLLSSRDQQLPVAAGTRTVNGQPYDRYVVWRTIPTPRAGRIEASPAALTYERPGRMLLTPGQRTVVRSSATVLVVRP